MPAGGSSLFSGFRVLGLYSNHVPHALRYHLKHRESYVVTAVGRSFHTFNVNRLGIVAVSNSLPDEITCLAADRMLVFAATGRLISAFARNKEVVMHYNGHEQEVRLLLPLGDQLISADSGGDVIVWDVQSGEVYLRLHFDPSTFDVLAMMHPSTYLNKVLLGSSQGALQLWNIKTSKLLFTFAGWSAGVTVLQQSPAVDVVGVGTATGRIIIHNIRLDETLMSFTQDWGPITSLSFRTDGPPIVASGSPQGHIAFWDLERHQLVTQHRHAHRTSIAGATFLQGEPILVTNGADNAIKVWIFDQEGGGARLLRIRQGHSAPPTTIHHHGNDGKNILSAGQDGTLQSFSTVHERFNKNLGSVNKKKEKKKKKGLTYEELRLPAITAFSSSVTRQSDWDGIVACHRDRLATTTWNYQRCTMGAHHLQPPGSRRGAIATAVDITSCGNFVVIGSSCGRVDVYNLQSGLHRGCYGDDEKAHNGVVRGIATDTLNQLTLTTGSDWLLKFWRFKSKKLEEEMKLNAAPASMKLHRESGMLALALDDFTLVVVDIETRRVVRKFAGHHGNINDMTFSPDGRWLVTVAMDCTIRVWDLPSGSLVDCFLVATAPVSVSLSPTGDFLATTHVDSLGLYLWTNKSLCGPVGLRPLPADYQPVVETLPGVTVEETEQEVNSEEEEEEDVYQSAEQLGAELVTLSLLPESRWKSLLHLDEIKKRNKPVAAPAAPAAAPFFLPTVPGLTPRFATQTQTEHETQINTLSAVDQPLRLLKDCGPAALSVELNSLAPEGGGARELLLVFIQMIDSMLASGRDFDLAHAYLALFLKLHLRSLSQDATAMEALNHLLSRLEKGWAELQASFDQSLCLLSYAKSALL
uniref:Small-subunit processome Utp21 domain-containing protein n=1 Tax=Astatotilapia calliptera TaxID=8154 RepID=A0AAX7V6N7_ASTCA